MESCSQHRHGCCPSTHHHHLFNVTGTFPSGNLRGVQTLCEAHHLSELSHRMRFPPRNLLEASSEAFSLFFDVYVLPECVAEE